MRNDKYRIVLASNSPRRKELLTRLGIPFEVRVMQDIDESYPETIPVNEVALHIAGKKADAYREVMGEDELIITADTVVIVGEEILGKPTDAADAALDPGIQYENCGDHVEITEYSGNRYCFEIPETIEELPVTKILAGAFRGRNFTEVYLSATIEEIGDSAFEGCTNLTEVHCSPVLQTIGNRAFFGCSNLSIMILPDTVSEIVNASENLFMSWTEPRLLAPVTDRFSGDLFECAYSVRCCEGSLSDFAANMMRFAEKQNSDNLYSGKCAEAIALTSRLGKRLIMFCR